MDAGYLNFHSEEHFSTLDSPYFLDQTVGDDNSSCEDSTYVWEWENERELNGDIGLIPIPHSTSGDYNVTSPSPPSKEDFQRIMTEWQHLINIETQNVEELTIDDMGSNELEAVNPHDVMDDGDTRICTSEVRLRDNIATTISCVTNNTDNSRNCNLSEQELHIPVNYNATIGTDQPITIEDFFTLDPIEHLANSDFDITKYVNETPENNILPSGPGPGGKRIDMKNQRYVIEDDEDSEDSEDDHIDVETVSETNTLIDSNDEADSSICEEDESISIEETAVIKMEETHADYTVFDEHLNYPIIGEQFEMELKQNSYRNMLHLEKHQLGDMEMQINCNKLINMDAEHQLRNETISQLRPDIKELMDRIEMKSEKFENLQENIFDIDVDTHKSYHEANSDSANEIKDEVASSTDEENVTEPKISPVIEAGDLNSLLEQFEASQTDISSIVERDKEVVEINNGNFAEIVDNEVLENKEIIEDNRNVDDKEIVADKEMVADKEIVTDKGIVEDKEAVEGRKDVIKSKQILDSLPEELINRIKQSSKRKAIAVIPPIPAKKRTKPAQTAVANSTSETVQLDHDYCISLNSSKKDSGFSSCEEDEKCVLRNQPTVKTADGKLMVSLLKVNTIKKRKLNLEEYKQRRLGKNCNGSPARIEDENARRLQRMNTQPCAPPNMEVKTLVSIGVNTDQSWGRLQEIVRDCRVDFSPNSLITSLVEHLPQIKQNVNYDGEHGEDKTIVYLDKNRASVKTANKRVQTIAHRRRSSSSSSSSSRSSRSRSRSPSPTVRRRRTSTEKMREVEERRVIYVGRIGNDVTRECLRKRFHRFGPINNVSVHFRRTGDNYGFVTFKYKEDAYAAVEHGNDDPAQPKYDLSFGGRRIFCQTTYADLDNLHDDGYATAKSSQKGSFDDLLREAQAKLLRTKRQNGKS